MRRQFNHFYEFGPFRLEVAERRLTNAGTSVPLSPKLFDALLLLVENHGRLLEKDDLIGALWPDSFVEEGNLTHYISQLRKTLGPGADGQALIETVPKRGYRFVAEVREVRAEVSLPQPAGAGLFAAEVDVGARVAQNSANGANEANGIDAEWLDWREPEAEQPLEPIPVATPRRLVWRWLIAAAVLLAAFTAYRWFTRPAPSARFAAAFQQMRPQKLTSNSSVMHVALSPDGKYLAYVQRDGTQRSLWLKQTSATNGVQLLPPAETAFRGMTFTPDGTQVYYVSYEKGSQIGKLYQIPALGGTPRVVLEDVDSRVTFAPDGKQLCFLRNDLAHHTSAWFIANSDGTQPRSLISYKTPDYLTTEGPAWSPDGHWIAGVAARHGANGPDRKLITVRVADGTAQTLVTRPWPWIGQVAWLPDNAGLVADAWHENALAYTDQIWLFPWPTGAAHLLINDLSRYVGVSMAVDGRALATIQSTRLSRLWVMPVATSDKAAPEKAAALVRGVEATLADVRLAVADFRALKARMKSAADELAAAPGFRDEEERDEAVAFLRWLEDNHFTFLGARDYQYPRDKSGAFARDEPIILEDTGLGLLRDPDRYVLRRTKEPALLTPEIQNFLAEPAPVVVAKSSLQSRVHRRVTADYVGVKRYDGAGNVTGERRFIGLFTADAYNEVTSAIPLLRRKVRRVLAGSGAAPGSHNYSVLNNILETLPRDEMFQIGELELLSLALGVLHLSDRPRAKAFVRRDRFNRFVSALIYLPKERFNSTLRGKIGALLTLAECYEGWGKVASAKAARAAKGK